MPAFLTCWSDRAVVRIAGAQGDSGFLCTGELGMPIVSGQSCSSLTPCSCCPCHPQGPGLCSGHHSPSAGEMGWHPAGQGQGRRAGDRAWNSGWGLLQHQAHQSFCSSPSHQMSWHTSHPALGPFFFISKTGSQMRSRTSTPCGLVT